MGIVLATGGGGGGIITMPLLQPSLPLPVVPRHPLHAGVGWPQPHMIEWEAPCTEHHLQTLLGLFISHTIENPNCTQFCWFRVTASRFGVHSSAVIASATLLARQHTAAAKDVRLLFHPTHFFLCSGSLSSVQQSLRSQTRPRNNLGILCICSCCRG